MIRSLLVFALVLLPSTLQAQSVLVRSGEHADFSRLVFEFPERQDWRFGRVEGGYEFRFSDQKTVLNLATVFSLIPRTRIQDLRDLGNGRLFIVSDCECFGDAFDLRDTQVVLDIKDGAATQNARPFDQELPDLDNLQGPPPEPQTRYAQSASAASILGGSTSLPGGNPDSHLSILLPPDAPQSARSGLPITFRDGVQLPIHPPSQPTEPHPQPSSSTTSGVNETPSETQAEHVSGLETTLLEQIGRAAAQGLLEANISETESHVATALDPIPLNPITLTPEGQTQARTSASDHMRVQTAVDRSLSLNQGPEGLTQLGASCLADKFFSISGWGTPPTSGADLSLHRASMLGEFDSANSESLLALIRHYLYLTFGAEASALARRYEADLKRPDILIAMAEIMDHGEANQPDALFDQMGCSGPVSLWAALAQPSLHRSDEIDRNSVIKAFSELPLHLRRHLGPVLSTRFLEIDDTETANALRNAIARAPGYHGTSFDLLEARLDLSRGNDSSAADQLEEIIDSDAANAPQAILKLIDSLIGAGLPVSDRTREIVSSLAFEHRGSEMGAVLLAAEIRSHAHGSDFASAFSALSSGLASGHLSEEDTTLLHETIFQQLVADGSNASFLRYTLSATEILAHLKPNLRRALVDRLLSLGFPISARELLGASDTVLEFEDRVLFARAALLEQKPEIAFGYLSGIPDNEANRLRAESLAMMQEHEAAAKIWHILEEDEAELREVWHAGNWQKVALMPASSMQAAAELMLDQSPNGALTSGPSEGMPENAMLRGTALLEESQAARTTLNDLLGDLEKP